ncbi:GGDEF domain-containing protein [Lampropedia puyangensis]|nr:diguanylate cyclase [Lampropedia puyangensis]
MDSQSEAMAQSHVALASQSAQWLSLSLNEKQSLLDAFASTLVHVDLNDAIDVKAWLNAYAAPLTKSFAQTWLVAPDSQTGSLLNSDLHTSPLRARLLSAGQTTQAQILPSTLTRTLASHIQAKQTSSFDAIEANLPAQAQVLHTSLVLNTQGAPIAALLGVLPLSSYLPQVQIEQLQIWPQKNASEARPRLEGLFLINGENRVIASAGTTSDADVAVSRSLTSIENQETPQKNTSSIALTQQTVPGTPWRVGIATWSAPALRTSPEHQLIEWFKSQTPWLLTVVVLIAIGFVLFWRFFTESKLPLRLSRPETQAWRQHQLPWYQAILSRASIPAPLSHMQNELAPEKKLTNPWIDPTKPSRAHTHFVDTNHLHASNQCMVLVRYGRIKTISRGAARFLRMDADCTNRPHLRQRLVAPHDYERLRVLLHNALQHNPSFTFTTFIRDPQGQHHSLWVQAFAVCSPTSQRSSSHCILFFQTVQNALEPFTPMHIAGNLAREINPITALPQFNIWRSQLAHWLNHGKPKKRLETSISKPAQDTTAGFVFYITIDGFSVLVSEGGQAFGNEALRYVANTLTHVLAMQEATSLVGHGQQDHFALACFNIQEAQAHALASQLQQAISSLHASYQGIPMALSISQGIAPLPSHIEQLDAQLHAADLACFDAAAKGITGISMAQSLQEI